MSPFRIPALLVLGLLVVGVVMGQEASPPASTALKDPQAVSVLSQTLSAAGGAPVIRAIQDYVSTGSVAYFFGQDVQGTATIRGWRTTEIRIDSQLPSGTRSWAVHQGFITVKAENGSVSSARPTGVVASSNAFPFRAPLFPSSLAFPTRSLGAMLSLPIFSLSYGGIAQIDGHSVHEIIVKFAPSRNPGAVASVATTPTQELFIDTSTFQIVMSRETLPKNSLVEVHYSQYVTVDGILMPFSISGDIDGQLRWTIQVNQVTFNTGLQQSSFALQ